MTNKKTKQTKQTKLNSVKRGLYYGVFLPSCWFIRDNLLTNKMYNKQLDKELLENTKANAPKVIIRYLEERRR